MGQVWGDRLLQLPALCSNNNSTWWRRAEEKDKWDGKDPRRRTRSENKLLPQHTAPSTWQHPAPDTGIVIHSANSSFIAHSGLLLQTLASCAASSEPTRFGMWVVWFVGQCCPKTQHHQLENLQAISKGTVMKSLSCGEKRVV